MISHENRLPADYSHELLYLIFFKNWERCCKNLLSAAVVIGALRVKNCSLAQVLGRSNTASFFLCVGLIPHELQH